MTIFPNDSAVGENSEPRLRATYLVLLFVATYAAVSDIATRVEVLGVSINSIVTILVVAITSYSVLFLPQYRRAYVIFWPVYLFLAYAIVISIQSTSNSSLYQNISIYICISNILLISFSMSAMNSKLIVRIILLYSILTLVLAIFYLVMVPVYGIGHSDLLAPRSLAMNCLFSIVAVFFIPISNRKKYFFIFVFYFAIFLSGSRMALFASMGLGLFFIFSSVDDLKSWHKLIFLFVIFFVVSYLFSSVSYFGQRMFGGDLSSSILGFQVNMMGRSLLWSTTWESALQSPIFGQGAGTSAVLLAERFGIEHPHNDYLRFFHDFGAVGLIAWLLAWGRISFFIFVPSFHSLGAKMGILSIFAFAAMMITDNPVVYLSTATFIALVCGYATREAEAFKKNIR